MRVCVTAENRVCVCVCSMEISDGILLFPKRVKKTTGDIALPFFPLFLENWKGELDRPSPWSSSLSRSTGKGEREECRRCVCEDEDVDEMCCVVFSVQGAGCRQSVLSLSLSLSLCTSVHLYEPSKGPVREVKDQFFLSRLYRPLGCPLFTIHPFTLH